ncbi:MAG TPA: hypothetical protein RMH99_22600, partial [Sandaracinaceae bacterium LLY-WYZ-13_1]|nr:hypothetical protein [Sandaracinaceae bacterium LLY-WYZ-13_1]
MGTEHSATTAPGPTTTGGGELRRRVGSFEHLGNLRRAKPALIFACWVWPLFAGLDVAHVWLTDADDLATLLTLRAVPMPWFLVATWRVSRRPPIGERELWILVYGAIYVLLGVVAFECLLTGGLKSYYAEATIAVLAATTVVPRPARTHAKHVILAVLVYPVTMVVGALVYPPMQGQLEDRGALYAFGAHTVMIWTTGAIVLLASHRLWMLRREIYETRSIGRYELRRRIGKGGMG